jgi:hypothetical protein
MGMGIGYGSAGRGYQMFGIRHWEAALRERKDWRRNGKVRSFARKLRGLRMTGFFR